MKATMNKVLKVIDNKIQVYESKQRFYESSGSTSLLYDRVLDELYDLKNQIDGIIKEEENASKKKQTKTDRNTK